MDDDQISAELSHMLDAMRPQFHEQVQTIASLGLPPTALLAGLVEIAAMWARMTAGSLAAIEGLPHPATLSEAEQTALIERAIGLIRRTAVSYNTAQPAPPFPEVQGHG
ncbi:hypothetical protein KHC28_00195 [Ancylobacter sonchi]|uniref:hypothetical protein n=1 Tax=Ancylobacter sonchi TaxID=1937790 RepID=UPI001BD3D06C|nr:hypothetical protein [Ancylobacter sonchi]MBS7532084.1 hypothetical protein [Ancylobacter sonchi]